MNWDPKTKPIYEDKQNNAHNHIFLRAYPNIVEYQSHLFLKYFHSRTLLHKGLFSCKVYNILVTFNF